MSNSFSPIDNISTETVFNIEDQLEDILNSLNTKVVKDKTGYQVYLMLFHYKDNCFYNYSKRTSIGGNGQEYKPLDKFDELFKSNFKPLNKDLLKNYKFKSGKDFIENNLEKITKNEAEYNVCKKLLSFLKNQSNRKSALNGQHGSIMEHIKKYLKLPTNNADSNRILKDSLLKIFRSLPQPKNALIAGWMYSYISQKNTGNNTTNNNTNCFNVLDGKNNIIFIPNMNSFLEKYKDEFLKNEALKYYFEDCYPLGKFLEELLVIGDLLEINALKKMSAILFPLYDFGQFRGLIYVVTDKSLKEDKADTIKEAIQNEQERYRLNIRDAMKCELNKRVFKDNLDDDVYTKILRNVHLVQNILLGVYSRFEDNEFKAVAMRSFKKLRNDIPQLVYLGEDDLKNNEKITFGNGQPAIEITTYCPDLEKIIDVNNPKVSYAEDGTDDFLIPTNPDYCKDIGSEIGLEILVPVVAEGKLKGIFDLYFPPMKDPESTKDHVRAIVEHLRTFLSLGGIHDEMVTRVTEAIIPHSVRAAVAAIMSRNMSHNIGSHILARIKFEDILKKLPSILSDNDKGAIAGLLFQEFHQYLQGKSDYLADISTEPYRSPASAFLYRDVILPFTEEVLLLDYIARNEKFEYDKISIRFFVESNGISHEIKPNKYSCPIYKSSHGCKNTMPFHKVCEKCLSNNRKTSIQYYSYTPENMLRSDDDIMVDLPGSVGRFAIYNIVEAIIRNATKHNVSEINDATKLNIRIKIEENQEDTSLYLCTIWDNLSDSRVVGSMNTLIDKTIVDHGTGILKQQNWGIAEMKICATLLQDKTFDEMERAPKQFLEACAVDGNFGYKFKILKARKVLLIGKSWDNLLTDDSGNKTDWKKLGCFQEKDIKKALATYRGYIPFELIIFFVDKESDDLFKSIEKNLLYMGNRVLLFIDNNIPIIRNDRLQKLCVQLKMKDICDKLKNKSLWSAILHYEWLKKKKANISGRDVYLYLGGDKEDELNSRWTEVTKNIKENFGKKISVLNELKDHEWNNISLSDNAIVFDRHATLFKKNLLNKKSKAIGDNYGVLFKGYHEPWDISSPLYLILLNPPKGKAAQLELFINLMEMASFKILVLDERVAEKAFEAVPIRGTSTIERFKRLASMNIFISTHVHKDGEDIPIGKNVKDKAFCLNIENGKPSIKYKDNGREEDFREEDSFDFIIVHQGVLEYKEIRELIANSLGIKKQPAKNNVRKEMESVIDEILKHIPYVVVDSGRGVPHNFPQNAKFISYSAIQGALLRRHPSKFSLIRNLMRLTSRKERRKNS